MKYLIKTQAFILGLLLMVGLGSSCTKGFEEMNKDPNNPVDVPAINIFTNAVYSSISRQLGGWMQHTYLGNWCQQWCKVQYIDEDRYMPRDLSGYFEGPYTSEIKNLTIVINKASEEGNASLEGAAKVLRVWTYLFLTDCWGDIPYSEATQGLIQDGIMTPKYDTQESIYPSLLAELEEANVLLAVTTMNFGSGDILYGGDPVLWRKFANSLKLRILNRTAGTPWSFTYNMAGGETVTTTAGAVALADADAKMAAILANPEQYPIFESGADNAELSWPGIPYRNPIYNTLFARKDQSISETMVDWLKARNDPRLHKYAAPTLNSVRAGGELEYIGFQNGRDIVSAVFPEISMLGTEIAFIEGATSKVMTYDEVEFLKAEHYLRTSQDAAAQAAYEAGIKASMKRWGLTDGGTVYPSWGFAEDITVGTTGYPVNYTTYLSHPLVAWDGTTADKFQRICEQKWASIFGQGIEAYAEVRRTGFPARIFEYELEGSFYPGLGLPIRLQYALSEQTYNTDNLVAAQKAENIEQINEGMFSTDGIKSQVWWHTRKNPVPTVTDVK